MWRIAHAGFPAIIAGACVLVGVTFTWHSAVAGTATPGQKCAAAKIKAAGTKANAQLVCYKKAMLKGAQVDQTCLTKAGTALSTAFQKAEAKGSCATVNDAAAIESTVDAFVSAIARALPAVPPATPTRTSTPTSTPAGTQTPATSTPSSTLTATRTGTATSTPTSTATQTPGLNDCCQSGPFCGPPSGGICTGAVPVFNASCSGATGQCVTFTPAPTTPAATPTPTATSTASPTATNTQAP